MIGFKEIKEELNTENKKLDALHNRYTKLWQKHCKRCNEEGKKVEKWLNDELKCFDKFRGWTAHFDTWDGIKLTFYVPFGQDLEDKLYLSEDQLNQEHLELKDLITQSELRKQFEADELRSQRYEQYLKLKKEFENV